MFKEGPLSESLIEGEFMWEFNLVESRVEKAEVGKSCPALQKVEHQENAVTFDSVPY